MILYRIIHLLRVLYVLVESCLVIHCLLFDLVWSSVLLVVFLYVLAKSWFVIIYSHEWSILVLVGYLFIVIDPYQLALSKLQIQGLD